MGIMDTVLLPLIKKRPGDVTDLNNHRSVAVSTCITKVIEPMTFDRIEELLDTTDNHLGLKSKQSTDVHAYRQTIDTSKDMSARCSFVF